MKSNFQECDDIKTYRQRTQSLQEELNKIRVSDWTLIVFDVLCFSHDFNSFLLPNFTNFLILSFQLEIQKLNNEKNRLKSNFDQASREVEHVRMAIQKLTAEFETQQRVTEKFVSAAESHCPRMETDR